MQDVCLFSSINLFFGEAGTGCIAAEVKDQAEPECVGKRVLVYPATRWYNIREVEPKYIITDTGTNGEIFPVTFCFILIKISGTQRTAPGTNIQYLLMR